MWRVFSSCRGAFFAGTCPADCDSMHAMNGIKNFKNCKNCTFKRHVLLFVFLAFSFCFEFFFHIHFYFFLFLCIFVICLTSAICHYLHIPTYPICSLYFVCCFSTELLTWLMTSCVHIFSFCIFHNFIFLLRFCKRYFCAYFTHFIAFSLF